MALGMVSLSGCGVVSQLVWCRNISKTLKKKKKMTSIKFFYRFKGLNLGVFFSDVPQQLLEELAGNAVQISMLPMVRAPMTLVFPWLFIRWPQKVKVFTYAVKYVSIYIWYIFMIPRWWILTSSSSTIRFLVQSAMWGLLVALLIMKFGSEYHFPPQDELSWLCGSFKDPLQTWFKLRSSMLTHWIKMLTMVNLHIIKISTLSRWIC